MNDIDFGVFLVPEENYYTLYKGALLCVELGYQSFWISDHHMEMYNDPAFPRLECWTTLTALASKTENIRVG